MPEEAGDMPEEHGDASDGRPGDPSGPEHLPARQGKPDEVPTRPVQGQELGPLMQMAHKLFVIPMLESQKQELRSKEKIETLKVKSDHDERMAELGLLKIVIVCAILASAGGATAAFILGEVEIGASLVGMALTGVFGLLAGRGMRGYPKKRDE